MLIESPLAYFGNRGTQQDDVFSVIQHSLSPRQQYQCCYDLFAGSGSISLYAMNLDIAKKYVMNDVFVPLTFFWQIVKKSPDDLVREYQRILSDYLHQPDAEYDAFYQALQKKWNAMDPSALKEEELVNYAGTFAFIINHAETGMPLLSNHENKQVLECRLIAQSGKLKIDEAFQESVRRVHELFLGKSIEFTHLTFQQLKERITQEDIVFLDPPYPDMKDAQEQSKQHIYQRTEPKAVLHKDLIDFITSLDQNRSAFVMFYGVLGMENHYPIVYPSGHVLRLSGSPTSPFQEYIEHVYLSQTLASILTSLYLSSQPPKTFQPCFHRIVETHALQGAYKNGGRAAIVWEEKEEVHTLNYATLNQCANRLAHHLLQQDIFKSRDASNPPLVAIYLDRGPQLFISLLAVMKAGAAFLPLETNQERLSSAASYDRIAQSCSCVLLTHPELHHKLKNIDTDKSVKIEWDKIGVITIAQHDATCEELTRGIKDDTNLNRAITPNDLAYVMYTSGSTGTPKGVEILHRGLPFAFESHQDLLNLGSDDRIAQFASIGFDASLMEVMMAWGSGASLHLTNDAQYNDSQLLTQFLQRHQITVAIQTPKMLATLNSKLLRTLRSVLIVGDSFPKTLSDAWLETVPQIVNGYGLTETTICTTLELCDRQKNLTIGKPILGLDVFLRPLKEEVEEKDSSSTTLSWIKPKKTKDEQPEQGALYVAGPCLARGYWQREDLTRARFRKIVCDGQEKTFYQTGDVGYYTSEGSIVITGRIDRQVKIRGQRIELDEVETCLHDCDEYVADVRVIVHTSSPKQLSKAPQKSLVAYIVPRDKSLIIDNHEKPSKESLEALKAIRAFIKSQKPHFMCPVLDHMCFVKELPRKSGDKKSYDDKTIAAWTVPCFQLPLSGEKEISELSLPDQRILHWLRHCWAVVLDKTEDCISFKEYTFPEVGGDSVQIKELIEILHRQAFEHPEWEGALRKLTVKELFDSTLVDLLHKLKEIKKELYKKEEEYEELKRTVDDPIDKERLDLFGRHGNDFYKESLPLPFYAVHSLLGDGSLDYEGSFLKSMSIRFQWLNTPDIETLENWYNAAKTPVEFINHLVKRHVEKIFCGYYDFGCYWLFGWSTGGLIAHLIALNLRAQGFRVFVYFIDTVHPLCLKTMDSNTHIASLYKVGEKINESVKKYVKQWSSFKWPDKETLSQCSGDVKERMQAQAQLFFTDLLKQLKSYNDGTDVTRKNDGIQHAIKLIASASLLYESELCHEDPFILTPDDTVVFSSESKDTFKKQLALGWETKGSETWSSEIKGDHFSLLTSNDLSMFVTNKLREQLDNVGLRMAQGMSLLHQIRKGKKLTKKSENEIVLDFYSKFSHTKLMSHFNVFDITNYSAYILSIGMSLIKFSSNSQFMDFSLKGIMKEKLGNYKEAIDDFTHAITLAPDCGLIYEFRGASLYKYADFKKSHGIADTETVRSLRQQAIQDFTRAIERGSPTHQAYYHRGYVHFYLGNLKEAALDFEYLLNDERLAKELVDLGRQSISHIYSIILFTFKDYKKAFVHFNICHFRDDFFILVRGYNHLMLKKYQESVMDFTAVINSTASLPALLCRGFARKKLRQYERAQDDFERVRTRRPGIQVIYFLMLHIAHAQKKQDQFLSLQKKCVRMEHSTFYEPSNDNSFSDDLEEPPEQITEVLIEDVHKIQFHLLKSNCPTHTATEQKTEDDAQSTLPQVSSSLLTNRNLGLELRTAAGNKKSDKKHMAYFHRLLTYVKKHQPDLINERGATSRQTALHRAAYTGNIGKVRMLLEAGANSTLIDIDLNTAEDVASTDEIRTLLRDHLLDVSLEEFTLAEEVRDKNKRDEILTTTLNEFDTLQNAPIHTVVFKPMGLGRQLRMAAISKKNDAQSPEEFSQLIDTIKKSNPALINEASTVLKRTPLHWAAAMGNTRKVELLLQAGADITLKDNNHKIAYDLTTHDEIKKLLAPINDSSEHGIEFFYYV